MEYKVFKAALKCVTQKKTGHYKTFIIVLHSQEKNVLLV